MALPQSAILPSASAHALFMLLRRRLGRRCDSSVRQALASLPDTLSALAAREGVATLGGVAFGADIWHELFGDARPTGLRAFPRVPGAIMPAPVTEADVLVHLRGDRADLLHEAGSALLTQLGDAFDVVESTPCFRYRDERDLTGFVDGTENPEGDERAEVALVGADDPDWRGGSYVHVQRYVHRMTDWQKLPVRQQEAVVGRTKESNEELPDDDKPLTAHISRVVIEDEGEELEILRQSLPYGVPGGDMGLMFASYCHTPLHFERMLARMVAPTHDGRVDHLLTYTRAVSGGAFFMPSVDALQRLLR
ncbi:Dyp-type peroxidase [Chitinibacteraceae bacterium HSL-7]